MLAFSLPSKVFPRGPDGKYGKLYHVTCEAIHEITRKIDTSNRIKQVKICKYSK